MTADNFGAELSDRLHRQGVDFQTADLDRFLAEKQLQSSAATDVELLVGRFIRAREEHQRNVRLVKLAPQKFREGLSMAGWCGLGAAGAIVYFIRTWDTAALRAGGFALGYQVALGILALAISSLCVFGTVRAVRAGVILIRSKGRPRGLPTRDS